MAYKVIILYRLYMPSYFLGTFTEYPKNKKTSRSFSTLLLFFQQSLHVKTEANGIRLCDSTLTKL